MNNWRRSALCAREEVPDPEEVTVDHCRRCGVAEACLRDALAVEDDFAYARMYRRGGVSGAARHRAMRATGLDIDAAFDMLWAAEKAQQERNRIDRHTDRRRSA